MTPAITQALDHYGAMCMNFGLRTVYAEAARIAVEAAIDQASPASDDEWLAKNIKGSISLLALPVIDPMQTSLDRELRGMNA